MLASGNQQVLLSDLFQKKLLDRVIRNLGSQKGPRDPLHYLKWFVDGVLGGDTEAVRSAVAVQLGAWFSYPAPAPGGLETIHAPEWSCSKCTVLNAALPWQWC